MASQKQIAANKRNAARSTGPKSAEGRAKVARNALKHGLAGHGVVFPDEMAEQIQQRKSFFWKALKPDGPMQQWMFDRICIESVRADVCLHQVIALRDEAARRASESWDEDRELEAEELGARLSGKPELVQPKLRQSRHGTRWLAAQWEELERQFDVRGEWLEADSERAMDLLGLPVDGRAGTWSALAGGDADGSGIRALIGDEVAALSRRVELFLDDRDDRARADAEAGLGADGPDVRRVLRYESEVLRRLRAWTRELRRLQDPGSGRGDRPHREPWDPDRTPSGGRSPGDPSPMPRGPDHPERSAPGTSPGTFDGSGGPVPLRSFAPGPRPARPARPIAPIADAPEASPSKPARTMPRLPSPKPATALNRHARRAQAALDRRAPRR